MLFPVTLLKRRYDTEECGTIYINSKKIVSVEEEEKAFFHVVYGEKGCEKSIFTKNFPLELLVPIVQKVTSVEIFCGQTVDSITRKFDDWSSNQINLKIISTSICVDKNYTLALSVVYSAVI